MMRDRLTSFSSFALFIFHNDGYIAFPFRSCTYSSSPYWSRSFGNFFSPSFKRSRFLCLGFHTVVSDICDVSDPAGIQHRYSAITSLTPLCSQITSFRMCSGNDIHSIFFEVKKTDKNHNSHTHAHVQALLASNTELFCFFSLLYSATEAFWFGLVWFCGISTIVGYLMPNPPYTYTLNIYDLVWFGFMAYQTLLVI